MFLQSTQGCGAMNKIKFTLNFYLKTKMISKTNI